MLTLLETIAKTTDFFNSKKVDSARLNAELIIGHALGLKRMQLYLQFERPLTPAELDLIRPLVKRRAQREPLQHILGSVEWGGLVLKCDSRALIPRPETESLLEGVLARLPTALSTQSLRILDLGTGSGALALGLAKALAHAQLTAVDSSVDALNLAKENAEANGLTARSTFLLSNWYDALDRGTMFEVIVSNPPYLTDAEAIAAEPEVRLYDPRSALVAADDGLSDLLLILGRAPEFLKPGGLIALETGIAQHQRLTAHLAEKRWLNIESVKDLSGRDRFVYARLPVG